VADSFDASIRFLYGDPPIETAAQLDVEAPTKTTTQRIEEARRHIARAEGALLLIWPNRGETHEHAREAFAGLDRAREALS
jgi:hypothetical protein